MAPPPRDPRIMPGPGDRWRTPHGVLVVVRTDADGVGWRYMGGQKIHVENYDAFAKTIEKGTFVRSP